MTDLMQVRADTAANWTAGNPVIPDRQLVVELPADDGPPLLKIGNGTDHYADLPYTIAPDTLHVAGGPVLDPLTGVFQDVYVAADASDTALWPNRFSFWWKTGGPGATFHRVFSINEYGEPRISPANSNTVGLRIFDRETNTQPVHTTHVFEYMDNRGDRNILAYIDVGGEIHTVSDITAEGKVTGQNIGAKVLAQDTDPALTLSDDEWPVGSVWIDTSA